MKEKPFGRRTLLTTALGLLASGCLESPTLSNAAQVLRSSFFGHPDLDIKRSAIAKLPYATMTARIGKGPPSLLVLARIERQDLHWVSGDRAILVTRGGRLVKTFGLPENLKETKGLGQDPVNGQLHLLERQIAFRRLIDIDAGRQYGMPIDSDFDVLGEQRIRILELDFDTILVRERNSSRTLNWNFDNHYWVDPGDGFVWRSSQTITRNLPPLEFEILKPAA